MGQSVQVGTLLRLQLVCALLLQREKLLLHGREMLFEFKIVCHVHSPPPGNSSRVVRTRELLPCLVVASVELMIQTQEAPDGGAQGAPLNDLVDHTMLQAELGGTRIFGQMLVHELFEHPRSG